jgi:hypothetical protein
MLPVWKFIRYTTLHTSMRTVVNSTITVFTSAILLINYWSIAPEYTIMRIRAPNMLWPHI